MNKEEKEELINHIILAYKEDEEDTRMVNQYGKFIKNKEIADLLDKQQKEIEELKNDKSFLLDDLEGCISKDKIKEKIKELENKEFLYKEEKRFNEEEIKFNYAKRILQELLGEE